MNKIEWNAKAVRQLKKISKKNQKAGVEIFKEVDNLKTFPDCKNVKQLVKHKYGFRLKVGSFRVLFDFEDSLKVIDIEEVKKRDSNTYKIK